MKLKTLALASALLVATTGIASAQFNSQAEMMEGPYVSLGGGVNWVQTSRFDIEDLQFGNGGSHYGDLGFKPGWTVNGAIGYSFGFGPRIEIEGSYRRNNTRNVWYAAGASYCGGTPIDSDSSRINQLGIMVNGAYDFFTGSPLVPYVGGGVGAVRTKLQVNTLCAADNTDHEQWRLAVQAFGGVDYHVNQAIRVGVRYTFMHTNDLDGIQGAVCCPTAFNEGTLDPNNHAITAQISYNFGAPRRIAPPPAPVAQAPVQRNFLVFFDFDKSEITPEADRVIVQAANNAKSASVTRITLTGHTDRAGPVAYNQRLSERRADAVKARLIREGIPAGSIVTIGRGESQPLVPTADGVREPQNRRVEIVL
jgi:outer membrane protein OmpA-like peptidoglycan-associated protein